MHRGRLARGFALGAVAAVIAIGSAPVGASDQRAVFHSHPIVRLRANQSGNWSGYNQGTLEQNGKLFSAIAGSWTVPKASPHKKGENEYSSTWIGIGGGCIDAGCLAGDQTLIQDGTEQDVDAGGHASYSAWWEIIPAPSVNLSGCSTDPTCTVAAGDRMSSLISSPADGIWTMSMSDLTRHWTWSQTVPYSSTEATAEWILETPVILDTSGNVFAALPNLTVTHFDLAQTDGAPAGLKASEEMQLVPNTTVIADPSAPDRDADGFNICAWATTCAAPSKS